MNREKQIQVTILVPIYQVEQYLGRMLCSIFGQTYPCIDYVFVNDGSTDNSLRILNETIEECHIDKEKYVIVNHDCNKGIAASRADCLANAKGDYVYFVDSDDWVEPDAIESMVMATNGGKIDIVGCDYCKDFESGVVTCHHENYARTCEENMLRCLNYDIATVLWKLLIRRCLFDNFVISKTNIGEDYIISIKLYYYAKSFVSIDRTFYHYVQYNNNRLSFQSLRSIKDHIECVREVEKFLKNQGVFNVKFENKLLLRKSNIRCNFVLNKKILDFDAYMTTFPEARGLWRKMHYSIKERVKLWMADHKLFLILLLLK